MPEPPLTKEACCDLSSLRHFLALSHSTHKPDTTRGGALSLANLPVAMAHWISPLIRRNLNCIWSPKQNMAKKPALGQESCSDPEPTDFRFFAGTRQRVAGGGGL